MPRFILTTNLIWIKYLQKANRQSLNTSDNLIKLSSFPYNKYVREEEKEEPPPLSLHSWQIRHATLAVFTELQWVFTK